MVISEDKSADISSAALSAFLRRAQQAAGLTGQVNVLITANEHMRRLNRKFRRKDSPTDVLSFPALQPENSPEKYAGDLAISLEIARQNAKRLGHSLQEELKILMLHGVLHLAGYDHQHDQGTMAALEERLRHELRLPATLISRTHNGPTVRQIAGRENKPRPRQPRSSR